MEDTPPFIDLLLRYLLVLEIFVYDRLFPLGADDLAEMMSDKSEE
jgi:hypothetical protein